jgi:hypothetical protein
LVIKTSLYYDAWSEKHQSRLRVLENIVLRRIFWPQSDEVTEEWKRLNNMHVYAL